MAGPRIGITRSGSAERLPYTYQRYHDRIVEAGGTPVDLYPAIGSADALIDGLDGLLVTGGADVRPDRYGAEQHSETDDGDAARDELEFSLLAEALRRDLPVLAICRGQQVLNVALSGALIQHIDGDPHRALDGGRGDSRWHPVEIPAGSRLAGLFGAGSHEVNSRHHQAVDPRALGDGLVVTAVAPDGIVEGLEAPGRRWVVAVQWHPEREEIADRHRPLFEAFVVATRMAPAVTAATGDA